MNFEELKSNLNTLNKESRIDELENIKDRLEVAMWYNRRDKEYCLELIDKRISELKGEQDNE